MKEIVTSENEDGSLDISVECSTEETQIFAELGLRYAIVRACIDQSASDAQIIEWAKLGRELSKEEFI